MTITPIQTSIKYDDVTIDENNNGELQIKGGGVSPSLIDDELKAQIGQLVHNGDLTPSDLINMPSGTKRVKIVVGSSTASGSNNWCPIIINELSDSNYYTRNMAVSSSGNDYDGDVSDRFLPRIGYNNILNNSGEINLYITENSKLVGNYQGKSNNNFNFGTLFYDGTTITEISSISTGSVDNETLRQVKIYAYNY